MISSSCTSALHRIQPSVPSQLQEEKIAAVQAKLEHAEQELAQFAKLPEMEEQLKQRMEALTQVRRPNQVRRGIHFHHIKIFPLYDHRSSLSCFLYLCLGVHSLSLFLLIVLVCLYYPILPRGESESNQRSIVMFVCAGNFISWSSFTFFIRSLGNCLDAIRLKFNLKWKFLNNFRKLILLQWITIITLRYSIDKKINYYYYSTIFY